MSFSTAAFAQLITQGRYQLAERELQRLAATEPDHPELAQRWGQLFYYLDRYEEAEQQLQLAIAQDPEEHFPRYYLYYVLLETERLPEAEELLLELIAESPAHAEYFAMYARLMLRTLHLEKSAALAEEALRLEPELKSARLVQFLILKAQGQDNQAQLQVEELVSDSPEDRTLLGHLFDSLMDRHRYREALQVGQVLLRIWPQHPTLPALLVEAQVGASLWAWPAWPFRRFGWMASVVVWAFFIGLMTVTPEPYPAWFEWVLFVYLGWILHSWVHAPLLRAYYKWRGIR